MLTVLEALFFFPLQGISFIFNTVTVSTNHSPAPISMFQLRFRMFKEKQIELWVQTKPPFPSWCITFPYQLLAKYVMLFKFTKLFIWRSFSLPGVAITISTPLVTTFICAFRSPPPYMQILKNKMINRRLRFDWSLSFSKQYHKVASF